MTIKEACEGYKKISNVPAMNMYIQKFCKKYLPIAKKGELIEETLLLYIIEHKDAIVTYNSVDKAVFYMISVIRGYTDLIVEDVYSDFDALMESGLMDGILEYIGADVDVYNSLFEMRANDYVRENNNIEVVIQRKIQELIDFIGSTTEHMDNVLKSINSEQVTSLLKNLQEANANMAKVNGKVTKVKKASKLNK